MEIITIEAGAFEAMNKALNSLIEKVRTKNGKLQKEEMNDWLDNQDVCNMMNISPRKLLTLRRTGEIPYSRVDQKTYYRKEDIIMYMEKILKKGND